MTLRSRVVEDVAPEQENAMQSSHAHALATKHAGIDRQLHDEQSRPAPDDSRIKQLKRAKLLIKQELAAI